MSKTKKIIIKKSSLNDTAQLIQCKCMKCGGELQKLSGNDAVCPYCHQEYIIDEGEERKVILRTKGVDESVYSLAKLSRKMLIIIAAVVAVLAAVILTYNKTKNKETAQDYLRINDREIIEVFCEKIFEKSYKRISKKELKKIKYIEYEYTGYGNEYCAQFRYSFEKPEDFETQEEFKNTIKTVAVNPQGITGNILNLEELKGLTGIGITKATGVKLSKDCRISYIDSDYDVAKLGKMTSPKYVKILRTTGNANMEDIGKFTDLEELVLIDEYSVKKDVGIDVSELAKCKRLKKLHLQCAGWYKNTKTLTQLEMLKSLYINNTPLVECEFLEELKGLEALSVMIGEDKDMSLLAGLTDLKYVRFLDNTSVNASVLTELKKLESVNGYFELNNCFESLSKLSELKTINISVCLPIASYYSKDFDISSLADLKNLSQLTVRVDRGCKIQGVNEVLNMDSLDVLTIKGRPFGVELDADGKMVTTASNLSVLELEWCKVKDNDYGFISKFSGLKQLSMTDCEVSDIRFVSSLTELEVCEFEGDKIESYEPLSDCKKLKNVWVPLSDADKLDLPASVKVAYR